MVYNCELYINSNKLKKQKSSKDGNEEEVNEDAAKRPRRRSGLAAKVVVLSQILGACTGIVSSQRLDNNFGNLSPEWSIQSSHASSKSVTDHTCSAWNLRHSVSA